MKKQTTRRGKRPYSGYEAQTQPDPMLTFTIRATAWATSRIRDWTEPYWHLDHNIKVLQHSTLDQAMLTPRPRCKGSPTVSFQFLFSF